MLCLSLGAPFVCFIKGRRSANAAAAEARAAEAAAELVALEFCGVRRGGGIVVDDRTREFRFIFCDKCHAGAVMGEIKNARARPWE